MMIVDCDGIGGIVMIVFRMCRSVCVLDCWCCFVIGLLVPLWDR